MIYNTETFDVSDADRFKEIVEGFRDSVEASGGSDLRFYRNVDNPNQVLATTWWSTAEACRSWAAQHGEEAFKKLGEVMTSADPEFLWDEI
jgi:heme-degrading monooxygenase HmoA